jgi:hypothetical protein
LGLSPPGRFRPGDATFQYGTPAQLLWSFSWKLLINVMNRCLVEPIEKYGELINRKNYFWDLRMEYPALHAALERVKVYRHNSMHILLNREIETKLSEFLRDDLEGEHPGDVPELWFALQQRVLDKLFTGIQVETAKLS